MLCEKDETRFGKINVRTFEVNSKGEAGIYYFANFS